MKVRCGIGLWIFLYVWLMVGFATGTATLLGPAKWITGSLRESSWRDYENLVMVGVILAYVAGSFLLARRLGACISRTRGLAAKCVIPCVATVAAGGALWGWMNPAVYARAWGGPGGRVRAGAAQFVFGPYPNEAKLQQLKAEGYAAVISLQHPGVVPFEPRGIAAEKEAAKRVGIELIHAPMLAWVSSNEESLKKVRRVARNGRGRYYVHCGLGRDRTNIVKRMLERMGAQASSTGKAPKARTWAVRRAERGNQMERGTFQELGKDLWFVPYPNEHEMYGNMLAGQVAPVLLLLDPADPEQAGWIGEARETFTRYGVPFTLDPLRPGDAAEAQEAARKARSLPRPLTVIVPFTPPRERPEVAEVFLKAYGTLAGKAIRLAPPLVIEKAEGKAAARAAAAAGGR